MKTITSLKQQKRNPKRINVYLDEEFAFGLSRIVAAWLSVGQEIDEEKIIELQSNDDQEIAYQKALNYISYRPRSIKETRDRLIKYDFQEKVIDHVLSKLEEKQLLDDGNFAREWIENRSAFKARSSFALRRELFQKGISENIIENELKDLDDLELAYKAAEVKTHRFSQLEWEQYRKKLSAYLARRGFHYAISEEVCREMWDRQHNQLSEQTTVEKRT